MATPILVMKLLLVMKLRHILHDEGGVPLVKSILVELPIRTERAPLPVTPSGRNEGKGKIFQKV
jgi:hypothetical protein